MAQLHLGLTESGDMVSWDTTTSPHMLVTGPAGSGKTNLTTALTAAAAATGWEIHTGSAAGVRSTIERVHAEMNHRLEHCALSGPSLLVVLDDVAGIYSAFDGRADLAQELKAKVGRIAAKGRSARIQPGHDSPPPVRRDP